MVPPDTEADEGPDGGTANKAEQESDSNKRSRGSYNP